MNTLGFSIIPYDGLLDKEKFLEYTTGVPILDTFLFENLDEMQTDNKASLSVAYIHDEIVGMFALSTAQTTRNEDSQQANRTFGEANKKYTSLPMISIDHFSVNQKYQFNDKKSPEDQFHVGSALLNVIYDWVIMMKTHYNVAIAGVSVDALNTAADWYEKQYFVYLNDFEENSPIKDTYKMIIGYEMIEKAYYLAHSDLLN